MELSHQIINMTKENTQEDLRKTVLLLQEELERLSSPPYVTGTVLDFGKKTARVSVDGKGIMEVPSSAELAKKFKRGSRVVLSPQTAAIINTSEFDSSYGEVSVVDEVMDGRLRVTSKGDYKLVVNALDEVKSGDEVMLDPSGVVAVERFSRKRTKYALEEVPTAPWTNIGGLEETISRIKEEVEAPFIHKEIYARYGRKPAKGILLYGPPGCGKTMIAKSIAYALSQSRKEGDGNGHFINVKGPEILDKWLGNSEANIRRIYEAARETANDTNSPVVVFIDEADSVLKVRGSGISTDVYDSIVPQFLAEMDGLNGDYNVITVLATNREDIIDPAILRDGRVDRRIKVPRPSREGAKQIFDIYLREKPFEKAGWFAGQNQNQISEKLVAKIYDSETPVYRVVTPKHEVLGHFGYEHLISGAMIKGIVDRATGKAIQREISGKGKGVSYEDLSGAVDEEFRENVGFDQSLVRDDWESVFGAHGRQYQDACRNRYLVLECMLADAKSNSGSKANAGGNGSGDVKYNQTKSLQEVK